MIEELKNIKALLELFERKYGSLYDYPEDDMIQVFKNLDDATHNIEHYPWKETL